MAPFLSASSRLQTLPRLLSHSVIAGAPPELRLFPAVEAPVRATSVRCRFELFWSRSAFSGECGFMPIMIGVIRFTRPTCPAVIHHHHAPPRATCFHCGFTVKTTKKFLSAALVFYLAIFTNTNLLRHANVDTFIVFRSLTPLLVIIKKKPCPSKLTFLSLVIIMSGAGGYVATDLTSTLTAYSWAFGYLLTITLRWFTSNIWS